MHINRLKIAINTEEGLYGFDEKFSMSLNFLASDDNTSGKSSILASIYYALGLEQLISITGNGSKVLPYVLRTHINKEDGGVIDVLESCVFLELTNDKQIISIKRNIVNEKIKDNLVTVYEGSIEELEYGHLTGIDYYVNMPHAAVNEKGYHAFLEKFLGLELPFVPSTDGNERKLYIQAIFSAMFIEQKNGWSSIMSGMPFLGISDVKTRVVEYILNLTSLDNQKKKKEIEKTKNIIENKWQKNLLDIHELSLNEYRFYNVPQSPSIIDDSEIKKLIIKKDGLTIQEYEGKLEIQINQLSTTLPKINTPNRELIESKLIDVQNTICDKSREQLELRNNITKLNYQKNENAKALEIIKTDIIHNKDSIRIQKLGSNLNLKSFNNICPTCSQEITDNLLMKDEIMSIEENLKHLQAQEELFTYVSKSQDRNMEEAQLELGILDRQLKSLRSFERVLKDDLVKIDNDISETMIEERVILKIQQEKLKEAKERIELIKEEFLSLGKEWLRYLAQKQILPKERLTQSDKDIIEQFRKTFLSLLKNLRYRSVSKLDAIAISYESYMPVIAEFDFDLKYDSSASDEIRTIWAFALSLLICNKGRHPGVLIFDEPKQHSIVDEDIKVFCDKVIELKEKCQTIIGITIKDKGTKDVINSLDPASYKLIHIGNRAIIKLK